MKELGATEGQLEEVAEIASKLTEDAGHFEVWPENWNAVQLFLAVTSQWRKTVIATMSKVIVRYDGFDYPAVEAVMRIHNVPKAERAEMFRSLQVMEVAAATAMNERT